MSQSNNYYSKLASDVRQVLKNKHFPSNDKLYTDLVLCEEAWRDLLLMSQEGHDIYQQFIDYIVNIKKNILDSRPFFRVRQKEFIDNVNPYIRSNKYKPLLKLRVNATFITWAMPLYIGPHKKDLNKLVDQINQLRNDFIIRNFPLILNCIKKIYHSSNLEMQDLIALASSAALSALDKFAPTIDENDNIVYTSVILSSIIRRINAAADQTIESSQLHLYPSDKKVLIEIAKLRKEGLTNDEIADKVDVSEFEIGRFSSGVYIESLDDSISQMESEDEKADDAVALQQAKQLLFKNLDKLTVFERKILILKNFLS